MTNARYTEYIITGHEFYWDLLGGMRGNRHHKGKLCWLSGDIFYNYKAALNGLEYEKQIDEIISQMKAKQIPDNLIITPDSAPPGVDICGLLLHKGFRMERISTGMAKCLHEDQGAALRPKNINLFRVHGTHQLKICGAILNTAFEYDLFTFEHYLDAWNDARVHFTMAECDGIPAGACMTMDGDGFVEIAWVGTVPGYRRKGIAGYLMSMAEKDALDRHMNVSVLTAFSNAVNAYKRVGYHECCEFKTLRYPLYNEGDT